MSLYRIGEISSYLPQPPRSAICRHGDRRRADASPTWSGPEGSSHNEFRSGSSSGLHPPSTVDFGPQLISALRFAGTLPSR